MPEGLDARFSRAIADACDPFRVRGDDGKRWIVRKEGQDHGPFAALEILVLVRKGELGPDHELVDVKTREAKPLSKWPGVQRALEDRARVEAAEAAKAARAKMDRRSRTLHLARTALVAMIGLAAVGVLAMLAIDGGARLDPRVVGMSVVLVLVLAGLVAYLERDGSTAAEQAFRTEASETTVAVFGGLALLVSSPLVLLAPFVSLDPTSFGDELGHAQVASEIARAGLSRGWIAGPLAGFPFGLHEPGLVPLLVRAAMVFGLSPLGATHSLATLAALLTPFASYLAAVRAHARPAHAFLGACALAWVASNTPFAGGFEAFFSAGLLPSVLALPLCILAAGEIVRAEIRWIAPLLLVIAVLIAPPLALATLLLSTIANALGAHGAGLRETLRAALAVTAIGAAIYGQGFLDLRVPFGPPPELAWRRVGFPASRLVDWVLNGELLDHGRTPVLSYVSIAAVLALLLLVKRPAARAALGAITVAIGWPVLARVVLGESATPTGAALVAWLVPVQAIALAPAAIAVGLVVALEESGPRLEQIVDAWAPELDRVAGVVSLLITLAMIATTLPDRLAFTTHTRDALASRRDLPCGPLTPEGYAHEDVSSLVRSLEGGRLWYASDSLVAAQCAELDALVLESSVPMAASPSAGAHVGSTWLAFSALDPMREGGAARAEALGVRHLLDAETTVPIAPWTSSETHGGLRVLSHAPSTALVGVGCVVETWHGSDDVLRDQLREELATPLGTDRVLSPTELVALDTTDGALVVTEEPHDDCDPRRAHVTETARESGALEAEIDSATPIDVVLRVTAFRSWAVLLDGSEVDALRVVTPGFYAVRVPAGRHRLVARANGVPWFWSGLALAAIFAIVVALARREWLERKVIPIGDRADPWSRVRRR